MKHRLFLLSLALYAMPYNVSYSVSTNNSNHRMISAAKNNHFDTVFDLIDNHDADVNARDKDGMTALMHAVIHGNHEAVIKLEVMYQADKAMQNNEGKTALEIAKQLADPKLHKKRKKRMDKREKKEADERYEKHKTIKNFLSI